MAKNQDGEYELVLGNQQLLGVFFIMVMLLAVLFALGYVVGRNSASVVAAEAGHKSVPAVSVDPAPQKSSAAADSPSDQPAAAIPAPDPVSTPEPPPVKETTKSIPVPPPARVA